MTCGYSSHVYLRTEGKMTDVSVNDEPGILTEALGLLEIADLAAVSARAERESARLRSAGRPGWAVVYEAMGLTAQDVLARKLASR
jgi:hypothetical protein